MDFFGIEGVRGYACIGKDHAVTALMNVEVTEMHTKRDWRPCILVEWVVIAFGWLEWRAERCVVWTFVDEGMDI